MSTDVENMYPSLPIDKIAEIVADEFLKSDLNIDVDHEELALYLSVVLSQDVIKKHGLEDVLHTRKSAHGRKIGVTTEEFLNRTSSTKSKFNKPRRPPTPTETRLMISLALAELIRVVMRNHVYTVDKKIKKQSSGGPIGNILTGVLATIYMLWWARQFLNNVKIATEDLDDFALYFLKYYVDDGNLALEELPLGAKLVEGKVVIDAEQAEVDKNIPADERTAKIILQIANAVTSDIRLTIDYPSNNESGWMPILDLQVKSDNNQLDWKFYKKKISNHRVMLARSAMPGKIKINSLTQEVIRRLRNCRRSMNWSIKAKILSEFMHSMMASGYSEQYRLEVLKSGLKGYQRQCEDNDNGIKPLYRPRSFQHEKRRRKKAIIKNSWYRPNDAVIFVPSTPNAQLAKEYREILDTEMKRINMKVKVVETAGVSMVRQLFRPDTSGCLIPDCLLCLSGAHGASHTRSSVEYQGDCVPCQENNILARYDGESGFNAAYRIFQHADDIKHNRKSNAFVKHLQLYHPDQIGNVEAFRFKSVKTFSKVLDREVFEGVMINRSPANIKLNSKSEWNQPSEIRVVTTRHTDERVRLPGS